MKCRLEGIRRGIRTLAIGLAVVPVGVLGVVELVLLAGAGEVLLVVLLSLWVKWEVPWRGL